MEGFWHKLASIQSQHDCVLVSLVDIKGSSPQAGGARMLIYPGGMLGTIGGGKLEQSALQQAEQLLNQRDQLNLLKSYSLGASFGQCCGGKVLVHYQLLMRNPSVVIFGSGHVGRELGLILQRLPVNLRIYDSTAKLEQAADRVEVPVRYDEDLVAVAGDIGAGAWVLVMTHSHQIDFDLVYALLKRNDLAFVGLIGSQSKKQNFCTRLRQRGLADELIDKLVCPIGLSTIGTKQPAAIAIATAAQLLQLDLLGA